MCDDDAPQLNFVTLHAIAALRTGLDFSEENIPTDIILTIINSVTSQAITLAELALGKFTYCKLKNMDTWNDWEACENKQLNQYHDLQMFGENMVCPDEENPVILLITLAVSCQTRWAKKSLKMWQWFQTSSSNTKCTCENIFLLC